jgi:phosphatidylinositol phospholipase C delta
LLYQQEDDVDEDNDDDDEDEQKMQQHLAPQYKHLITIKAGKPKGGTTSDALKCDPNKVRRLSLSEQELAKAVVNHGTEIVRYTSNEVALIFDSPLFPFAKKSPFFPSCL